MKAEEKRQEAEEKKRDQEIKEWDDHLAGRGYKNRSEDTRETNLDVSQSRRRSLRAIVKLQRQFSDCVKLPPMLPISERTGTVIRSARRWSSRRG